MYTKADVLYMYMHVLFIVFILIRKKKWHLALFDV